MPPKSFCMLVGQLASNHTFTTEAATILPSHGLPQLKPRSYVISQANDERYEMLGHAPV